LAGGGPKAPALRRAQLLAHFLPRGALSAARGLSGCSRDWDKAPAPGFARGSSSVQLSEPLDVTLPHNSVGAFGKRGGERKRFERVPHGLIWIHRQPLRLIGIIFLEKRATFPRRVESQSARDAPIIQQLPFPRGSLPPWHHLQFQQPHVDCRLGHQHDRAKWRLWRLLTHGACAGPSDGE